MTPVSRPEMVVQRQRMVEAQLVERGITAVRVLRAFATIEREVFVPESLVGQSYADNPLDIGDGQTISQPYIVARTLAALDLTGGERVLEVGTGSGYQAALLGCLAGEVQTIDRIETLARSATERLAAIGATNVHVHVGDGTLGWPERAPYQAIAVAAGGPVVPRPLLDQLAVGGRLVMPVATSTGGRQILVLVRRVTPDDFEREELEEVRFVPLIGAFGYPPVRDR
jgi:protein-L-isoaspartate(D-aspartate) O-methyltransferase